MAKSKVEFNPAEHGKDLKIAIRQASDAKIQIEASNDTIREIRKNAQENLGIDATTFNKMLTIYHKDAREKFENDSAETLEVYDAVFTNN